MTDLEDRFVLNSQSYKNNGKLLLERLDYIIIFQYELRLVSAAYSVQNGADIKTFFTKKRCAEGSE